MRAAAVGEPESPLQLATLVATSTTAAAAIGLRMTISPADETQCLRQLLGEGRQFGRTMGEVLDGPQLLGRRRRNGLRFLTGALRPRACLPERLGDLRGQLRALATELGDLFARPRRLGRCLGDAIEILYPLGGALDDLPQVAAKPIVSENRSTCVATSRSRPTSAALSSVVAPRSVSCRTAFCVPVRTRSAVFSICDPASRVRSPAAASSAALSFNRPASPAAVVTRFAAWPAPWLARRADAATSSLEAWISSVVAVSVCTYCIV